MARLCKCQITHEVGDTDSFVKIKGKYYKSQEIYDEYKKETDLHKKIIYKIANDFLGYESGQTFPTILTRKLKELEFYPNEVILRTIEKNSDTILYWMNNKNFDNDVGRIGYIFAILKGSINEIYKDWKRNQQITIKTQNTTIEINHDINELHSTQKGKNISKWLGDDEL